MRHELVSNSNDSPAPRVSVVVNVWGGDEPASLKRSLSSISSQRLRPDEVVVVVDGPISTEIEEEIQRFRNEATFPARTIYIQSPKGLWNARNVGIGEAEHEIVALHDADDVMHPERLQFQTKAIVENGLDVLGSPVYEFDSVQERILGVRSLARSDQLSRKMIWQNVVNHSSVTLRKSVIIGVGGYRNVHLAEDYDLWLRLIFAGKNVSCTEEILQAFSVDSNLSKRRGGAKFISSEIALHRLIRSKSSENVFVLWVRLISRLTFRLSPRIIRKAHRVRFQVIKSPEYEPNLLEFVNNPPRRIIKVS
jgi:glycosyltransferase involved in cell wall biosynthesis